MAKSKPVISKEGVDRYEKMIRKESGLERKHLQQFISGFTRKSIAEVLLYLSQLDSTAPDWSHVFQLKHHLKRAKHPWYTPKDQEAISQKVRQLLKIVNLPVMAKKAAGEIFGEVNTLRNESASETKKFLEQPKDAQFESRKFNLQKSLEDFFSAFSTSNLFASFVRLCPDAIDDSKKCAELLQWLEENYFPVSCISGKGGSPAERFSKLLNSSCFLERAQYWQLHGTLAGYQDPNERRMNVDKSIDALSKQQENIVRSTSLPEEVEFEIGAQEAPRFNFLSITGRDICKFLDEADIFSANQKSELALFLRRHMLSSENFENLRSQRRVYEKNPDLPFEILRKKPAAAEQKTQPAPDIPHSPLKKQDVLEFEKFTLPQVKDRQMPLVQELEALLRKNPQLDGKKTSLEDKLRIIRIVELCISLRVFGVFEKMEKHLQVPKKVLESIFNLRKHYRATALSKSRRKARKNSAAVKKAGVNPLERS